MSESFDWSPLVQWHGALSRGERAELRRASPPEDAAYSPAFSRLLVRLPEGTDWRRLAMIATLVAGVEKHDPDRTVAGACSGTVREGRMRRVLETKTRDELPSQLGSLLRLLGPRANLIDLANSIYFWGDMVRRRWAMDYYSGGRT